MVSREFISLHRNLLFACIYKKKLPTARDMQFTNSRSPRARRLIILNRMSQLTCVNCSSYLISGPYQCSCGDRICSDCYHGFIEE